MGGRLALFLAVLGFAALAPTARPSLAQGADESWVPLTVIYTSDIKGKIEPCG
jgi:2',3'-cyclic-nucleotide 2'-phosphodiesterase (5'-nucleotidase family)